MPRPFPQQTPPLESPRYLPGHHVDRDRSPARRQPPPRLSFVTRVFAPGFLVNYRVHRPHASTHFLTTPLSDSGPCPARS